MRFRAPWSMKLALRHCEFRTGLRPTRSNETGGVHLSRRERSDRFSDPGEGFCSIDGP